MKTIVKQVETELLKRYIDFDRSKEVRNNVFLNIYGQTRIQGYAELEIDIAQNGIKNPLRLFVFNGRAILGEGNHRLEIALRLGIEYVPISIEFVEPGTIEHEFCLNRESKMKRVVRFYELLVKN